MERQGAVGRLAIAAGVVGLASIVSLGVFFAVGEPFGTINDIGNGALAILSAGLAVAFGSGTEAGSRLATWSAGLGAVIAVLGSWLVISGTTGFVLAGLVSSVGFALIGLWLIVVSRGITPARNPRGLSSLGMLAGVTMVAGLVAIPAVLLRLDDMATLPGWAWLAFIGWLGTSILYPIWAIWLGRAGTVEVAAA